MTTDRTFRGRAAGTDRQVELLEELVSWTRFANREAFLATLKAVLKDPKHLRAYEATDGNRSQGDVAAFAGLSQPAISGLWARWRRLGLVTDIDQRPKHLARPSDLGLEIPDLDASPKKEPEASA